MVFDIVINVNCLGFNPGPQTQECSVHMDKEVTK